MPIINRLSIFASKWKTPACNQLQERSRHPWWSSTTLLTSKAPNFCSLKQLTLVTQQFQPHKYTRGRDKTSIRCRRRAEKWILLERLKGKSTQKTNSARDSILGAIIDIHGDNEHNDIANDKSKYNPRYPFLEMLNFCVHHWTLRQQLRSACFYWVYNVVCPLGIDPDLCPRRWRRSRRSRTMLHLHWICRNKVNNRQSARRCEEENSECEKRPVESSNEGGQLVNGFTNRTHYTTETPQVLTEIASRNYPSFLLPLYIYIYVFFTSKKNFA